jgi:hypothetical protein
MFNLDRGQAKSLPIATAIGNHASRLAAGDRVSTPADDAGMGEEIAAFGTAFASGVPMHGSAYVSA